MLAVSALGEWVYRTITAVLTVLSRLLALFGGALLLGVTTLVVVSVSGRALIWAGLGPIPGDFELVEAATALAVFSVLMTVVSAFILWRLWAGMADKLQYNETSFILQFPVWWGYAVCVPVAAVFVLVCAWTVVRSVVETRTAFADDTSQTEHN